MLHSVTIAAGKTQVLLPNGVVYDAADTVILTEDQYRRIPQDLFPGTVVYTAAVPEDEVTTQGATVAAPAALTSAAAAGSTPTKAEFDALRADVVALRTTVASLRTALVGVGKPLANA